MVREFFGTALGMRFKMYIQNVTCTFLKIKCASWILKRISINYYKDITVIDSFYVSVNEQQILWMADPIIIILLSNSVIYMSFNRFQIATFE